MKQIIRKLNHIFLALVAGGTFLFSGCSDDFLNPDPLSFYEPGTTFTTEPGLMAAMAICDRHMKLYWVHNSNEMLPIGTEYIFSDLMVASATDKIAMLSDVASALTPTSESTHKDHLNHLDRNNSIWYFWKETYNGIMYCEYHYSICRWCRGIR